MTQHPNLSRAAMALAAVALVAAAITWPHYTLCLLWVLALAATTDGRKFRNPRIWK